MKLRIVFEKGRDLNIFAVVEQNLDGKWNRYTDGRGRKYVVNAAHVNYIEIRDEEPKFAAVEQNEGNNV